MVRFLLRGGRGPSKGNSRRASRSRRNRQFTLEAFEPRFALDGVPTVPTGLTVAESVAAGAVNVSLTWQPSTDVESGIKNYKVFRDGSLIGSPTTAALVDTAVSASSLHAYTVVAVNNADVESEVSAPIIVAQLQQGVSDAGLYSGMTDSFIAQNAPTQQNGNATTLRVDGEEPNNSQDQMILLRWELSEIPADAIIENASLILNVNDASAGQNYNMFPLRANWAETSVTYQLAQTGDPWETAGARGPTDRSATSMGTIGSSNTGKLRFPFNAAGRAEVASWAANGQANHGLVISDTPTGTLNNALEFSSSEHATVANRPLLFIAYSLPQPVIPSQLTVRHTPRLQLGDAPSHGETGSDRDQVEILWQTEVTGEGTDSFQVDYRHKGSSIWSPAGPIATNETGAGTRTVHSVTLANLLFDQDYEYRVRHTSDGRLVQTYEAAFHTRLMSGSPEAFSFVAYGDSAYGVPPTDFIGVQNRINQLNPEMVLLLGDNAYGAAGTPSLEWGSHASHDMRYDPSINPATPAYVSNHIEYPTVGNADLATNDGQATRDNFSVPLNGPTDTASSGNYFSERAERNYSFDYGNVHFATFDGSTLFGTASEPDRFAEQLAWLSNDLAESDAPWKVVFTHYPAIASDRNLDAGDAYYQQLVSTLRTAGVDLLLVGDSHTYQRSYPLTGEAAGQPTFVLDVDNNYAKGAGLVQMVVGTGGRSLTDGNFLADTHLAKAMSTSTVPASEYAVAKFDVVGNVLTVRYVAADDGATLDTFSITAPAPLVTPGGTLPVGETVWTAAAGPRHVTGDITVPVGATLRIEPGVNVSFAAGFGLIVQGKLLAEGTPTERISLSAPSGSAAEWDGIQFQDTLEENRLTYVDMSDALARSDAIHVAGSRVVIDHVVWSDMNGNILELDEIDLVISNSIFPEVDAGEPIESNSGVPEWGGFVLAHNIFGRSLGNSDTVDFEGGTRTGRVMRAYGNIFYGGPDEALDFDVDAHIEGNVFMSNLESLGAPEPNGTTSSISTGPYIVPDPNDPEETIELPTVVTIVRNIFYLVDQAVGIKQGTFVNFINNTVIGAQVAALNFYDPSRMTDPGGGALVEGTIFYNTAVPFGNVDESQDGPGTFDTDLTMNHSMVDATLPPAALADLLALGVGNLAANPRFVDPTGDFHLQPNSPAIGTGPGGIDMGAYVSPTIPTVTGAWVRNTNWSPAMLDHLAATNGGVPGLEVLPITGGVSTPVLPWSGINEITIHFSEGVVVAPDSLKIEGANVTQYSIASFSYDRLTSVAKWTLATPIDLDKVQVTINANVVDLTDIPLDGDANLQYPTGDGVPGGFFILRFDVLPGDATGDGEVSLADIAATIAGGFRSTTDALYNTKNDLNADGKINVVDTVLARNHIGTTLPPGDPGDSPPATAASSLIRAARRPALEADPAVREVSRSRTITRRSIDIAHDIVLLSGEDATAIASSRLRRAASPPRRMELL
jgi:hypothetical protein